MDALGVIPPLPATGPWLRLDRATRRYVPLTADAGVVAGWQESEQYGGLSAQQLRDAGIDPADVVDVVATPADPPGTDPADVVGSSAHAQRIVDRADAQLWRTDPPSTLDVLIGRGPTTRAPGQAGELSSASYDLAAEAVARYTGDPLPLSGPGAPAASAALIRDIAQPWRSIPAYVSTGRTDGFLPPASGAQQRYPRGLDPYDPEALEVDARVTGWTGPDPRPSAPAGEPAE